MVHTVTFIIIYALTSQRLDSVFLEVVSLFLPLHPTYGLCIFLGALPTA